MLRSHINVATLLVENWFCFQLKLNALIRFGLTFTHTCTFFAFVQSFNSSSHTYCIFVIHSIYSSQSIKIILISINDISKEFIIYFHQSEDQNSIGYETQFDVESTKLNNRIVYDSCVRLRNSATKRKITGTCTRVIVL